MDGVEIERVLTVIAMFILLPITLGGNLLTIVATIKFRRFHCATSILIANLAVSDLLIAVLAVPLRISQLMGSDWTSTKISCRITISFTLFFCTASVMNLTLISIDRFRSISSPFSYIREGVFWNLALNIWAAWLISFTLAFLPIFLWGGRTHLSMSSQDICRYLLVLKTEFVILVFSTTVFLPFFVMSVIYVYIFVVAKGHLKKIRALEIGETTNQASDKSQENESRGGKISSRRRTNSRRSLLRDLKAARMTAAVLGFFVLFVFPIVIVDIAEMACKSFCVPTWFVKLAVCLSYMNPAVNIFIYAATSLEYRRAYTKLLSNIFHCCGGKKDLNMQHTTHSRRITNGHVNPAIDQVQC